MNDMTIIIVGCGKIGRTILADLVREGHDITAVDPDPDVMNEISGMYDAMVVCGSGIDCDILLEAGADKADIVLAATDSDETNMLSCFLAKRLGAKHTVARVRNSKYSEQSLAFMRQQMGISQLINPDNLAAQEIYNVLKFPNASKFEYFARRSFVMVELKAEADFPLNELSCMELRKKYPGEYLISAVQRGSEVFIPDGNFVIKEGDRIELTVVRGVLNKLLRKMGILKKQARSVMILGGSRMGYYLAKKLEADGTKVKLIDSDPKRCEELSEALPNAMVLCGDGSEQDLLLEEGLDEMDGFAALTGMDEENILISYYAKSRGVDKTITKVNRDEMCTIAANMGMSSLVSAKRAVSDALILYARSKENSIGNKMEGLYKLLDGRVEAIEFMVSEDFPALNVPLSTMKLKSGILISGILRGRKAIIPGGMDVLQVEDRVVVLTFGSTIRDLKEILPEK